MRTEGANFEFHRSLDHRRRQLEWLEHAPGPEHRQPEESPSTVTVTPTLGGRFVRVDYTWGYQGKPQEGSVLIGFDPKSGEVSGH
jgi:hypothetical protein